MSGGCARRIVAVLLVPLLLAILAVPAEAGEDHFRVCLAYEYEHGINGCGDPPPIYQYRPVCDGPLELGGAVGLLGTNGSASTAWTSCPRPDFVHLDIRWPAAHGNATFSLYQAIEAGAEEVLHYQVTCSVSTATPVFVGFLRETSCSEAVHEPLDDGRPWKRVEVAYAFDSCLPVADPCEWWVEADHLQRA